MVNLENLVPQSPLEGPPLPSGARVKWTDDPERVARAIRNYAAHITHPEVARVMEKGIQKYRYEKGFRPGQPVKDVKVWLVSQQRAISNYARYLESKLP